MRYWRLLRTASIAMLMIALLAPAQNTLAAVGCTINYSAQNDWGSGATMNVTISNPGTTAVNGWTLTWTFPGNQQISNLWNGSYTQTGAAVSVKDLGYNASIPANGGSTSFGFNLSYSGANATPAGFSLNGIACNSGTPPPTTPPPTTPPPTTPPPTTPPPTTPPPTTPPPTTPPPTTPPPTTPPPTTPPPTTPPPTTPPPGACQVGYTMNQWSNGFTADVKITNNGSSAISGWTLTWSFANGQQITGSWNATVSQSGANVTASNPASYWNGTIGANGGSVSFGFQATQTGTNSVPAAFRLNGVTCNISGVPTPTTPPPTTPPPTTPPPTTPPPTTPPPTTPPPTTPPPTTPPPGAPVFRVDAQGRITKDGVVFHVHGGSWFGLEGRHEPSNDPTNPSGAPMEQYMGNVFWAPSGRTYMQDVNEFKAMGINVIRLPLVHQTLSSTDPQGMAPNLKNDPSVRIANSRLALETVIKDLNAAGIYVLLDIHSCSNYVGWRKGRLDARPPYVDATRDNYDFTRETYSCAATNNPPSVTHIQAYNESMWLDDLATLAGMQSSLGVTNILGIDIFNEPWDYSWTEWKTLSEHAYTRINSVNPNILIFVEGISASSGNQDGTPSTIVQTPHGTINPNWGENLFEAGANPPAIPKDRIVFSPHTYGPSVAVQPQFMDPLQPQCTGLEGDAAGNAKCNIVINPTLLRQGWEEHFGYLHDLGYAVVIGEYGGNMDWPRGKSNLRDQARYSYLTNNTVDAQWQNAFVDYLISKGITDTFYWSINPESGDTGGLYTTPYDPVSNTSGWGTWGALDTRKTALLARLWAAQ